jgi:hypothetical protein
LHANAKLSESAGKTKCHTAGSKMLAAANRRQIKNLKEELNHGTSH